MIKQIYNICKEISVDKILYDNLKKRLINTNKYNTEQLDGKIIESIIKIYLTQKIFKLNMTYNEKMISEIYSYESYNISDIDLYDIQIDIKCVNINNFKDHLGSSFISYNKYIQAFTNITNKHYYNMYFVYNISNNIVNIKCYSVLDLNNMIYYIKSGFVKSYYIYNKIKHPFIIDNFELLGKYKNLLMYIKDIKTCSIFAE